MFEGVVGHKKQIELLSKAIEKNKLAHAYVFSGPDGVGKKLVAKKIGVKLLDMKSDFHPDFLEIGAGEGIKIEEIRELTYKLSLMPYQAKYKIALIDNADQMSTEAANALLKTLEEPKSYTFIFLITSNPNRLPKTILSRSQKINFGPLTESERSQIEFEPDEDSTELLSKAEEYFQIFNSDKIANRLIMAYEVADLETPEIKKVLETWILKLEKSLLENPGKKLATKITQTSIARKFLDLNANSKLLLTNLILNT
ncbi:MAG: AAA family ATPase [Candidatus Doudnabacteria bacterium]|nr:AAA family ATPase [Candidatus Doudnabacteria bacterium]